MVIDHFGSFSSFGDQFLCMRQIPSVMDRNYLLPAITILLVIPTVHSCMILTLDFEDISGSPETAGGAIFDNVGDSAEATCAIMAPPDSNGNYEFNCIPGYSATLNPNSAAVQYNTDHGDFQYTASTDSGGWYVCGVGCTTPCF